MTTHPVHVQCNFLKMKLSHKILKAIAITLFLLGFSIAPFCCHAQDTICLTDFDYNTLLIQTQCRDIIQKDSVLIFDKNEKIVDLTDKLGFQTELTLDAKNKAKANEKYIKTDKRRETGLKVGLWGSIVGWVGTVIYMATHK